MDTFKYEPIDLERPAFRLLHLLKGTGPVIECILYQAYLDGPDTIPYDALSYTWGSTEKTATVKVNNKALDVTENLHSALHQFRSKNIDTILWVDAICIDQSHERERGHQVQQMCKIYSQAEEVLVWLGQATDETDLLMDCLRRLEKYSSKHAHRTWDLKQWKSLRLLLPQDSTFNPNQGLDLLLKRSWFRRVWILQEIANARKASVWCGTKSVSARMFALAPTLTGIKPERHVQAVLDIMPGRLRQESWWGENRDLYNLLLKFSKSEASDPRDKVYALLGISSDAWDTDSLRPNYTKDLLDVIRDTSTFLFGPSDVSYETMPKLLESLTSRSAESFLNLAKTANVSEVNDFLTRRGLEVPLSEGMIRAAAGNERSGKDIISLFLQERGSEVQATDEVIKVAAGNMRSGSGIISLLLQQEESKIKVTEKVINAVHAASAAGQQAVVSLLLDTGVNVNAQGTDHGNALQAASWRGHEAVVRLLLEKGVNVNTQGGQYGNALHAASWRGYEAVVSLLLEKGANINAQGGTCGNALQAASCRGHEAVVSLLLDNGANPNTQGGHYSNALYAASSRGHEAVVRLLKDVRATTEE